MTNNGWMVHAGTRMRKESVELRKEPTIHRNMVFPSIMREMIQCDMDRTGEGFAEWVRNACRYRLEK